MIMSTILEKAGDVWETEYSPSTKIGLADII